MALNAPITVTDSGSAVSVRGGFLCPVMALRKRQETEYRKLCNELRLTPTSTVLKALTPPVEEDELGGGEVPKQLHEYDFSSCYIGDRQFRPLGAALALDRQLLAVLLPNSGMMDSGMVALCEQLKRSPTLECLDVSNNRFSYQGVESCVSLAKNAQRLVLVRAKDTCLDAEFCEKRGLDSKYAAARQVLQEILSERASQMMMVASRKPSKC